MTLAILCRSVAACGSLVRKLTFDRNILKLD